MRINLLRSNKIIKMSLINKVIRKFSKLSSTINFNYSKCKINAKTQKFKKIKFYLNNKIKNRIYKINSVKQKILKKMISRAI